MELSTLHPCENGRKVTVIKILLKKIVVVALPGHHVAPPLDYFTQQASKITIEAI